MNREKHWRKCGVACIIVVAMLGILVPVKTGAINYQDVNKTDWYYESVLYGVDHGFVEGNTTWFQPNNTITRGDFILMLSKVSGGAPRASSYSFTDLSAGSSVANAVQWAVDNGIVKGTSAKTFSPNAWITREQMATFIDRYIHELAVGKFHASVSGVKYWDDWAIQDWAKEAVYTLTSYGLLKGNQNGIAPGAYLTRAEAVAMCTRVHQGMTGGKVQFIWPVTGWISSTYGSRYIFGSTSFHQGLDIAAAYGTEIHAAADGVVTFAGERGTYGNLIILRHGKSYLTYYAHCSSLVSKVGDSVKEGQTIAKVGATGRVTGNHCHFEVRYNGATADPLEYLPANPQTTAIYMGIGQVMGCCCE